MKYLLRIIRILIYTLSSFFFPKIFFKNNCTILKKNTKNALLLTPFRRENEFEKILYDQDFGVYLLEHNFQKKINHIFFAEHKESYFEYLQKIKKMKIRIFFYKVFLGNLIKYLKNKHKIDMIINFAIHYKSEIFFDEVSTKKKIKFLTLHRECLYCNKNIENIMMKKLKKISPYKGTRIFVHNEIVKKIFIKSKFCKDNQISVIGPIRVDRLLKYKPKKINNKKKNILFYLFGSGTLIDTDITYGREMSVDPNYGWYNLIINTYKIIISKAKNYPNHNFIFKTKFASKYFLDLHNKMTKKYKLHNIKLMTNEKNYSLLKKADLVISFGSTTILESLMLDKSVLVPFFDEVKIKKYQDFIPFKELINSEIAGKSKKNFDNKLDAFLKNKIKLKLPNRVKKNLLIRYLNTDRLPNTKKLSKTIESIINIHK